MSTIACPNCGAKVSRYVSEEWRNRTVWVAECQCGWKAVPIAVKRKRAKGLKVRTTYVD